MQRFITLILSLAFACTTFAQKTNVVGRILDSESGEALMRATVQLMKPDSTSMVSGAISNNLGSYSIKNVEPGTYIIKISYIGYRNFFRQVVVDGRQKEQNVGSVMLLPSSVELSQAVITGTARQVEVKADTIIFNADAFRTQEGAVLEDLIKKLPGVQVDSNGGITVNGKTVSKILVGGKEFFGNDRNMSMKNLPAEIVDKVRTYDKQSDRARMTGIDDGEEETVIDLTVKKGFMQGWFGNVQAGFGSKDRYQNSLNLNRFQDRTQASIMANNGNAGGRGGGGDRRNTQVGATMALERGKVEIGGNVRVNGSRSESWTKSSNENYISTRTSYSNSFNESISRSKGLNSDFRIEWKPDSMTTVLFRPNVSFNNNTSRSSGSSATFNADPYNLLYSLTGNEITNPLDQMDDLDNSIKVNQNSTGNKSKGDGYNFSGNLTVNRRLSNTGRNLSFNFNGSYSDNENKSYSLSDVRYFQFDDSVQMTYRYRTTPNTNTNYSAGFSYTEPLIANKLFLSLDYNYNYSKRHSDGKTFDMGDVTELLDAIRSTGAGFLPENYRDYIDADLSRYTDDWNYTHNINLQFRLNTDAINLNLGVNMQPQRQKISYQYQGLDTVASRNFMRVSPTLNFRYRFTRQHTLRVTYRANTSQPSITDMFNMTDNSNPLNIRMGNPDLKPSFTQNASIEWNDYVTTRMQNFSIRLKYSTTKNSISSRTEYNEETGGRITQPQNINGNWNASGSFGFSTPLFVETFMFNTNTSMRYNNNVGYIYQNQETMKNTVKNTSVGEQLSLNYRTDLWDVGVNGNLNYSHVRSELVPTNNRDTYDFSYGAYGNLRLDNGIGASTDIGMSSRRGYSSSELNTNELIWNAQVSYSFLQGKAATLMFRANDILNKRSNISRNISATSRSDSENNAIYSYWMATFRYRFNFFGSASARRDMRMQRREMMMY